MRRARRLLAPGAALALALVACAAGGAPAQAHPLEWRLEQPPPPARVPGEEGLTPIGLGRIGDIEFWAPNRGLLITDGNPPTIPPGIWAYDGVGWHELATVCGATDGRIAWAGPEEFWTVSDGRPGQAPNPQNGEPAPLADNTLCHFAGGQVVASYGSLAFQPTSYQPLHAAACNGPGDCWFGGDPLPEPQVGAFHLHWNGSSLAAEAGPQGHPVQDMRAYQGRLYESVRLGAKDQLLEEESAEHPSLLHELAPAAPTFRSLLPRLPSSGAIVPQYPFEVFPAALDSLHLSSDGQALWAAAGPVREAPHGSREAGVAVLRYENNPELLEFVGSEVLSSEVGRERFPKEVVNAIAANPGSESAWLALDTQTDAERPSPAAHSQVVRVSSEGTASEELPSAREAQEGIGPKGAAAKLACPAPNDCWLATTQGWLYHLGEGAALPRDTDPAFAGPITFRPPDEGVPQVPPDAPPVDDSGLLGEPPPSLGAFAEERKPPEPEVRAKVALLTRLHSRVVHGTTLELRFHLAVRARLRLIAKRNGRVVAATPKRVLAAGNRRLLLRLDPRRWPTKLQLEQHALAPLPTVAVHSEGGAGATTVSTSMRVLPAVPGLAGLEPPL